MYMYDLLSVAGISVGSLNYLATCVEYSDSNSMLLVFLFSSSSIA